MIDIRDVLININKLPYSYKTKDLDNLIKSYYATEEMVSYNYELLYRSRDLQRAFFYINLHNIDKPIDKLYFIEKYLAVFSDWSHTDQLISKVSKCDSATMLKKMKQYISSEHTYTRRWGYVMLISHPLKRDDEYVKTILTLLKNEYEYPVYMAEAWLICELAVYHPQLIFDYLKDVPLNKEVIQKAISKICDSYRISEEWTKKYTSIRANIK